MSDRVVDVFVVEDEPRLLSATASVLREEGLEVRAFARPGIALLAIETERPSVIVTDMDLPEMSGYELMLRIRGSLGFRAPRFVLVSGADVPRPMRAGFDAVLEKPFQIDDLVAQVRRLGLRRRRSGTMLRSDSSQEALDDAGEA